MEPIRFIVPSLPVAQPRPRATMAHGGRGARIHEVTHIKNKETGERKPHPIAAFKATVRLAALQVHFAAPITSPLKVSLIFVFPMKKKARAWKPTKPDCDNLAKSVLDALNGLMFKDDSQVVELHVQKFHGSQFEQPRAMISIEDAAIPEDWMKL